MHFVQLGVCVCVFDSSFIQIDAYPFNSTDECKFFFEQKKPLLRLLYPAVEVEQNFAKVHAAKHTYIGKTMMDGHANCKYDE